MTRPHHGVGLSVVPLQGTFYLCQVPHNRRTILSN